MGNKSNKEITRVAEEAAKILRDNPELKYFEAIEQAKKNYEQEKQ